MIADVTHFTMEEGGELHPWPFKPSVKPSNPELLCNAFRKRRVASRRGPFVEWRDRRVRYGVRIWFHSLVLSDGAEWDCVNGFRKKADQRPH